MPVAAPKTCRSAVIDGDGHIMEEPDEIVRYLPKEYRSGFEAGHFSLLFPPLDHFHGMPMRIRGAERHGGQVAPLAAHRLGPDEWLDFLTMVNIERTVLYPTYALSHGKIRDRAWAVAVTRAYNEWLAETYLGRDPRFRGMAILPLQEFDFVKDVARELPMKMLGRLLGLPNEDLDWLVSRGDALIGNSDPDFTDYVVDQSDTSAYRLLPFRSPVAIELFEYAQQALEERRLTPTHDVLTRPPRAHPRTATRSMTRR